MQKVQTKHHKSMVLWLKDRPERRKDLNLGDEQSTPSSNNDNNINNIFF